MTLKPVAYKLVPMAHPQLLAQPGSLVAKKAFFATKQLFVTPHDDKWVHACMAGGCIVQARASLSACSKLPVTHLCLLCGCLLGFPRHAYPAGDYVLDAKDCTGLKLWTKEVSGPCLQHVGVQASTGHAG